MTTINLGRVVGQDGQDGEDGRGITSITKTDTSGLIDTYTITYTDNTTSTFEVTNGANGTDGTDGEDGNGIVSITKTATVGLVDTYTILYTDGTTSTFEVTNGSGGSGTSDYADLENKPSINSVTLSGNKTSSDLGIQEALVSGTNIKTINYSSILGDGNLIINGSLPAYPSDTTQSYSLKLVPVPGTPTDIPVELTSAMFTDRKVYSTRNGGGFLPDSGVFGTYEITIPADVTSVTFKLPHWTTAQGLISNYAIAYRINGTVTTGTLVPKSNVQGVTSAGEWEMHTENVPSGATELFLLWPMDHNRALADQSGVWGDEICVFHEGTGYTLELQWVADIN